MALNVVHLQGKIIGEIKFKKSPTGKDICEFPIGIASKTTLDWFRVECWEHVAHYVKAMLRTQDRVIVHGALHTNAWEDKATGEKKRTTYIRADYVHPYDYVRDNRPSTPEEMHEKDTIIPTTNFPAKVPELEADDVARMFNDLNLD